ncbi:MAG: hypothetical protein IPL78_26410 [Chloroflexi bacterium]|nr:hypothetical protein [Chloroflexota bacterium]
MRKRFVWLLWGLILVACQNQPVVNVPQEATPAAATLTPVPIAPTLAPTPLPTHEPTATPINPALFSETHEGRIAAANLFTYVGDTAIVERGPDGAWDGQFTDPGAAVYAEGQYHLFHNGFVGWPAPVSIAHATSADGITWTRAADPIFDGNDLPYTGLTVLASSALVEPDGTWVLYFYTWDQTSWPTSTGAIGRATAPTADGPWTADAALVLQPGGEGEWDNLAVRAPSVVRTDEGYVMFYGGQLGSVAAIGKATSADGRVWTKYDDPATTEAPYAESDPIFTGSTETAWDSGSVYQPRVQYTPDGWVMLYAANRNALTSTPPKHGLAISQDGLTWTRTDGAVIDAAALNGGGIWYTELLYQDGTYFLFFELGKAGRGTEVYLATRTSSLNPER